MADSLLYKLRSGKPSKLWFFIKGYAKMLIPHAYTVMRKSDILQKAKERNDCEYIWERVEYYNKLNEDAALPTGTIRQNNYTHYIFLGDVNEFRPSTFHKTYFFDIRDVLRYFPKKLRMGYIPGDVYFTPQFPAIVKSRLLAANNGNSILLKLNKLRHFIFVNDPIPFEEKKPQAIFRGKIRKSRLRRQFMEMYFGSDICDCGVVGKNEGFPEEWLMPKKTIREHLEYKFIITLEGNDVASNLKWVMSSNSIAVMTRPTCETWFMEGKLIPGFHYIEIKDDLSDLRQKLEYYSSHLAEAKAIIAHAHEYVSQFLDTEREKIISLLVAEKYFKTTKQI